MNKTAIKNFAIWARNKLIADISYRAGLMGITAEGIQKALPQSTGTTEFYDIGTAEPYSISSTEVKQREKLVELIRRKEKETNYKTAYKYVIEEAAYTWFNRLIAVRFMEVNDYLPSHIRVLSSDSGKTEPDLLTKPFDAELSFTVTEEQEIYRLKEENKSDDTFRLLFIKQCNALNEILPALFEKTSDYTELSLNLSVVDQDGVLWHLVHDIPEEDFDVKRGGQVEIIGWLYQYYNTEPKNEAFGKKGKISKEEIPAVTQLFTPDWIVRYMVENSLGRLWVEGHPNDELKAGWKYYLEEAEQEPEVQSQLVEIRKEYAKLNPKDIKVIDPCMGSGHILVYAFDVLMQIYESAGYSQREAARSILENNLYGLDIDDRAFQLAYFAIMMKARQYNRRILNGENSCHIYAIQESNDINRVHLNYFGIGMDDIEKNAAKVQLEGLLDTLIDAKEYGSILNVENYNWDLLRQFVASMDTDGQISMDSMGVEDSAEQLKRLIDIGETMARKYWVIVTNPPYAGTSNLSANINNFVKKNYPDSKSDLFAVFIERCHQMTADKGLQAMITQHSWMFLSSFEKLREKMMQSETVNMAHLGARAFEEIGGEVVQTTAFVRCTNHINGYRGIYCRLIVPTSQQGKEEMFLTGKNRYMANQNKFAKIPGNPVAYWVSKNLLIDFEKGVSLGEIASPKQGLATGDNGKFTRIWFEVSLNNLYFNAHNRADAQQSNKKWFPYNKGGEYRKWFGNNDWIVDWSNDGFKIRNFRDEKGKLCSRPQNMEAYFQPSITWSKVSTSGIAFRYKDWGHIFDVAGTSVFAVPVLLKYLLAYCNSKVAGTIARMISPTVNYEVGHVSNFPVIVDNNNTNKCCDFSDLNIAISKLDWDSFETSWDFERHPLTNKGLSSNPWNGNNVTLEACFRAWSDECDRRFDALKANEEELNRIFIDIYGLQDELTPEVEDKEVTVRRADLRRDIKSLLSYAVGCMFGRYSLDTAGLAYAGGTWDARKYEKFKPDADNVIPITDEEYLEDDIVSHLCEFLKVVYGEEILEENLDFIAKALGNKGDSSREIIRNYFLNDFFKDHCQTYSVTGSGKRPIYWLFDSGKNNGFKALIYLHRYNADTIGNLRIDYLHRMQRIYESEMSRMQDMIDHSTNVREVAQATKRREKLAKQLKECREYDEKLAHLALSRIDLDLDDGVKKNYRKIQTASDGKFYEVLADSVNIMSKE